MRASARQHRSSFTGRHSTNSNQPNTCVPPRPALYNLGVVRPVTFEFQHVDAEVAGSHDALWASVPRKAGVFRIFDVHDRLILLEKTHNLAERIDRFYAEERETRALDLRRITGRIEFCRTDSPFETLYLLHSERRQWFPATYRRMRTFPRFFLLKINPRQRFPRIYATREVKAGVRYFGPFKSRAQLDRMKTTLERAFKLRPCEYNIRGNDPYPDCLYFQMRTCSRPCNNDVTREDYLGDVNDAIAFLEGRDEEVRKALVDRMERLADATQFEDAARIRKRLEILDRARRDHRDASIDLWKFDFLVVMEAGSTRRRKAAFVTGGRIAAIEEHDVATIEETLQDSLDKLPPETASGRLQETRYDDFCLVSNFMTHPVKTVHIVPLNDRGAAVDSVVEKIETEKKEASVTRLKRQAGHREDA